MRGLIVIGLFALSIGGCATVQEVSPAAAETAEATPGFDFWGTGEGSYFYHRLIGDCETLVHGHGRNMAWGQWRMPLDLVVDGGAEESEHGGAFLRFSCTDGSACIQQGALSLTPDRVVSHAVPFETMQRARDFSIRVANLKSACGIGG